MNNEVIYAFLTGVPVAALLMFSISHFVRSKDSFEKQARREFAEIRLSIAALDKSLALMQKDLEHVASLTPVLSDIVERTGKLTSDIENSFKRLRNLEAAA